MSDVLFVVMPFGGVDSPHLGVSLLKGQLHALGIRADVAYLNFVFAEEIGLPAYQWMAAGYGTGSYPLAGEWVFARHLFEARRFSDDDYVEYLGRTHAWGTETIEVIRWIAGFVEPFINHCVSAIPWDRYQIVGFTSTFEQNVACLALAKRIKEHYPDKMIVMGGANCTDVMGLQIHKSFDFIDYVFTAEADLSFPELVRGLGGTNNRHDSISGYVRREGGQSLESPPTNGVQSLDILAYPDFDDYFATYRISPLRHEFRPMLHMETARGCWWGVKNHCAFCGLNLHHLAFRTKSPERAIDELVYLVARYGVTRVMPTDNIISMDYFRTLLPQLKRRQLGIELFYETKANLKKEHVKLLADAGVKAIQPGIESFSTHTLSLMNKGVSPLQNVQLLKWCKEFGVYPLWNILYGIPGEQASDYAEVIRLAEPISYLTPPVGGAAMRLDRFSEYFEHPDDYGIHNIRPYSSFRYVYPFDDDVLMNIAHFFDFDFDGKDDIARHSANISTLIDGWKRAHASARLEVVSRTPEMAIVFDSRPNRKQPLYYFEAKQMLVIEACEKGRTIPQILEQLRRVDSSLADYGWVQELVRSLADCQLLLEHHGLYLSLILPQGHTDVSLQQ